MRFVFNFFFSLQFLLLLHCAEWSDCLCWRNCHFCSFMPLLHTWTIPFCKVAPERVLWGRGGTDQQFSQVEMMTISLSPIEWFILFYCKVLLFLLIGIFILLYNDRYSMDLPPVLPPVWNLENPANLFPRVTWTWIELIQEIEVMWYSLLFSETLQWGHVREWPFRGASLEVATSCLLEEKKKLLERTQLLLRLSGSILESGRQQHVTWWFE